MGGIKSPIIIILFSFLMLLAILPGVFASTGGTGSGGGNLSIFIISFGIIYISGIAWYLNKRSKEEELPLEFEKYDNWNRKK